MKCKIFEIVFSDGLNAQDPAEEVTKFLSTIKKIVTIAQSSTERKGVVTTILTVVYE